ncbi:MAG TPA: MFS transporter [Thermohalobaculum sp.]|nr:MFS transporter [Thermohalobaculum sp.]
MPAPVSVPLPNQFALLRTRRFGPLFLVQFLGAFNDQVYQKAFVALVTYRLAERVGADVALLGVIASALFILPFAVVTPTAGQIADRVDKAKMMRIVKAWEIVVMGLAVVGYHLEDIRFLYFVLFLMGAQSAVFAPIKYSVLPEYLSPRELLGGNGLVQGSTFVAILIGTILGNELILTEHGVTLVSFIVVGVAVAGFAASLFAPPVPPRGAIQPVDWMFPRAIWHLLRLVAAHAAAFRAILLISWFWFLGATFLSLLPAYTRNALGADEGVLTVLLTAFSVGVALGALAVERLGRGEVSLRLAPAGALGLACMAAELWLATPAQPLGEAPALADRAAFFASPTGWRITIDFVAIAAFAGIYVTPLNAVLQSLAPEQRRARYIAASNVVDATLVVASALISGLMLALGLAPKDILVLLTLTGIPVALITARQAPATRLGRVALMLWPRGPQ